MELDNRTIEKFSRQILMDEIGYDGQLRLLSETVWLTGPDPWREWAARYLRAAGLEVKERPAVKTSRNLRLIASSGRCPDLVIPVSGEGGRTMVAMGLAMTQWLRTLASGEMEA